MIRTFTRDSFEKLVRLERSVPLNAENPPACNDSQDSDVVAGLDLVVSCHPDLDDITAPLQCYNDLLKAVGPDQTQVARYLYWSAHHPEPRDLKEVKNRLSVFHALMGHSPPRNKRPTKPVADVKKLVTEVLGERDAPWAISILEDDEPPSIKPFPPGFTKPIGRE